MNLLKYLLAFLVILVLTIPFAYAQSVDCPRSGAPVTVDGKWTGNEWDDAAELPLITWAGYESGEGFVRIKYDASYFYAIIDFTSVSNASGHDGSGITFDTKNDGGNKAKPDDYRFDADYNGQGLMGQGTGSGFKWGLPLPKNVLVGASVSSSPHSSGNHPIFEFGIPLSIFAKTSAVRFAVAVWYGWNAQTQDSEVLLVWPQDYILDAPNTWGTVNFPTPVPEFASTVAVIALTFALATLVTRIRAKRDIYPV